MTQQFTVTVSNNKVKTSPEEYHVQRGEKEEFHVCLDNLLMGKYELKVDFPTGKIPIKITKSTPSEVVFIDENKGPETIKFDVGLEPLKEGISKPITDDPFIVND